MQVYNITTIGNTQSGLVNNNNFSLMHYSEKKDYYRLKNQPNLWKQLYQAQKY